MFNSSRNAQPTLSQGYQIRTGPNGPTRLPMTQPNSLAIENGSLNKEGKTNSSGIEPTTFNTLSPPSNAATIEMVGLSALKFILYLY